MKTCKFTIRQCDMTCVVFSETELRADLHNRLFSQSFFLDYLNYLYGGTRWYIVRSTESIRFTASASMANQERCI